MKSYLSICVSTLTLVISSQVFAAQGQVPAAVSDYDFYDLGDPGEAKTELGRMLFFDKILSGNQNISCASCHHPLAATGDGLSLPVGEGGSGLGVTRSNGDGIEAVHERVPRNAPPVFNLGAWQFTRMFHDGRVEPDATAVSGFRNPAGSDLPHGLDNVLAVQAMFPVTSAAEMAGQAGENAQADAAALNLLAGPGGVWEIIAGKLQAIPAYVDLFQQAYPDEVAGPEDISFVQAANAIAAFEASDWRFDNSAYDRYLRHDNRAMGAGALRGMHLFNGKAGCAACHSGAFQTDHEFHAIAMPQIGPGKGNGAGGREDFGRERVTGDVADRYRFRTPSLRNVAITAPYGHSGAYNTLDAVIRHHLDPVYSLNNYNPEQAVLPPRADLDALDFIVMNDSSIKQSIASVNELSPVYLTEREIADLVLFMHALTDPAALDMRKDVPARVPSGLSLAE